MIKLTITALLTVLALGSCGVDEMNSHTPRNRGNMPSYMVDHAERKASKAIQRCISTGRDCDAMNRAVKHRNNVYNSY